MKTITIANHKGGCAKTTTALNLVVAFASKGKRVLAIDLDGVRPNKRRFCFTAFPASADLRGDKSNCCFP